MAHASRKKKRSVGVRERTPKALKRARDHKSTDIRKLGQVARAKVKHAAKKKGG